MNENSDKQNVAENSPFSLFNIIVVFLKYRKKILITTSVFCIVAIILYFFVFNLIYTSTASIRSTSTGGGGLLGGLDVGIGDISGFSELGLGSSKSIRELAAYEEILISRRCIEPLIKKFDLMDRENYRFMDDAIKDFIKSDLKIRTEKLAGIMYISVEYKDPVIAKEMVEFLLNELDKINIELNVQSAKSNREFIQNRYFQAKDDLTKAEDTLKSFQMIYGVAPDLQIKAAAQSAFTLEAELKTEEVKLDILKKILNPDQLEVKTQEAKINSLRNRISEIRNSTNLNDFLSLGNSPQIAMNFLRLERDVEIQTKILTFLLPLYEKAKIDEKRETPTIIILDKPTVAERKTKPKRLTMTIIITFFGLFSSTSVALLYDYLKKQRSKIKNL